MDRQRALAFACDIRRFVQRLVEKSFQRIT